MSRAVGKRRRHHPSVAPGPPAIEREIPEPVEPLRLPGDVVLRSQHQTPRFAVRSSAADAANRSTTAVHGFGSFVSDCCRRSVHHCSGAAVSTCRGAVVGPVASVTAAFGVALGSEQLGFQHRGVAAHHQLDGGTARRSLGRAGRCSRRWRGGPVGTGRRGQGAPGRGCRSATATSPTRVVRCISRSECSTNGHHAVSGALGRRHPDRRRGQVMNLPGAPTDQSWMHPDA